MLRNRWVITPADLNGKAVLCEHITALPGSPLAIRLRVFGGSGRGQPLWKAKEAISWAEKHKENRVA